MSAIETYWGCLKYIYRRKLQTITTKDLTDIETIDLIKESIKDLEELDHRNYTSRCLRFYEKVIEKSS
jgi:hypothetical protein